MKRLAWPLAAAAAIICTGALLWPPEDSATATAPVAVWPIIRTDASVAEPPKATTQAPSLSAAATASLVDEQNRQGCLSVKQAAVRSPDPPWPAALKPWAMRVAQQLRARGDPTALAVSTLVGKVSDWDQAVLGAQVDAVARAAVLTTDPTLYLLALRACRRLAGAGEASGGPCGELTPDQLLRLEPNDALLWLDAAARAHGRADRTAELDALYRASVARSDTTPIQVAPQWLAAAMPQDTPVWVQYALLKRLADEQRIGLAWGALHDAHWMATSCKDGAVADGNVLQLCENIARNLLERSTHPDTLWTGTIVAREVGWPEQRVAPFSRNAYRFHQAKQLLPTLKEATCGSSATQGLAMLQAIVGDAHPLEALRSDRMQQGMEAIFEQREDARARAADAKE